MIKASLIISFYNKIDYLKLVLASIKIQTEQNIEVIIADDGSSPFVIAELNNLILNFPIIVKHIWQEDKGFRKNKILNKAILASESNYLIFIDGDCVPHSNFIEDHLINAKKDFVITGRRVNLSKKITNQLTEQKIQERFLEKQFYKIILDGVFGKSTDVEKGIFIQNKLLLNLLNKKTRGLLGCNFSLHKEDILSINGFDERYEAPSIGEDTDIQYRLELIGKKIKSINHSAVQFHLYHKLQERPKINLDLFEEVKKSKVFYTPHGIKK